MDRTERLQEEYKVALDFLKFEANTLWQIFNAFFIGNNIFLVLVVMILTSENGTNWTLILGSGVLGFITAVLWLLTFRRNSDWYAYRMKQAKRAEKVYLKNIKKSKWSLLNKDAKIFADSYNIRGMKNNQAGELMIALYLITYSIVIIWASCELIGKYCCT